MQETRRHFEVLLRLGAEVAGSPVAEQLAQHVRQYLQVRSASLCRNAAYKLRGQLGRAASIVLRAARATIQQDVAPL